MENEGYSENTIVIKRGWLTTTAVVLVFFIAGSLFGVLIYRYALVDATARIEDVSAREPSAVAQAPTPAQPEALAPDAAPSRVEDVSADDDPQLGNKDAPVVIVEFSDFECPFCARFRQETLDQIVEQYGDNVLFVYRDFPLSQMHPHAQQAAEASECADDQGAFWEYHDVLFENPAALDTDSLVAYAEQLELDVDEFTECLDSGKYTEEVLADLDDGRTYGVTGTPTFFINGVPLVGALPFSSFQEVIDAELGS